MDGQMRESLDRAYEEIERLIEEVEVWKARHHEASTSKAQYVARLNDCEAEVAALNLQLQERDEKIARLVNCLRETEETLCRDMNRATEAELARDALTRQLQEALIIPEDWKPTADSINALPDPIRRYIHDLEARCDPAGEVIELGLRRDQARELEAALVAARSQLQEVVEERDRLRDPWVHVGHLTSLGVSFHAGAEFPGEGETVLVAVHDVTGERHQIHTHTNERGRWHWPSFGVAWMRIPALNERSKS